MWSHLHTQSIPGKPVQLNRPRFSKYGVFRDKKNREYQDHLVAVINSQISDIEPPTKDTPISLVVEFVFPRPKRLNRKKDYTGRIPRVKRPDTDNLIKMILDALQRTHLMHDDGQVVMICASDWIQATNEQPHTKIMLYTAAPYQV